MSTHLKMTIMGFDDPDFMKKAVLPPFIAHVNPETYKQSVQIFFSEMQAQGTSANDNKHSHTEPRKLNIELLLDRTGALGEQFYSPVGVFPDIEHFKNLALNYEGNIHKPRYLILLWGTLIFNCQLEKLDVEYKLFSPEGVPMRAVLKTTFREYLEAELRTLKEKKSSPDLTHVRTVKDGDTLPAMANDIYGDPGYYLEVARVNEIVDFRNLEPGREIVFPPIDKME